MKVPASTPQYTTQDCCSCGYRVHKTLSTRTHSCPKCGFAMDRDQNTALNTLKKGLLGMEWPNITFG
ncbi:zinc ribbon domain-containing protein [Parathermosynechococcus lividus]